MFIPDRLVAGGNQSSIKYPYGSVFLLQHIDQFGTILFGNTSPFVQLDMKYQITVRTDLYHVLAD
jgi:hypothetical protein